MITSDHLFTLLSWPSSLDIVIISLQGIFVNNTRLMVIFAVYIVVIYKLDLLLLTSTKSLPAEDFIVAIYSSCWRIPGTEDCPSCTLTATLIGMPLPNHKSYIPCYIQEWSLKNQIAGKCTLSLLLHLWQFYHVSINQQVMLGANSLNPDIPLQCTHLLDQWACVWCMKGKATLECWQPFNRLLGK